MPALPALAHSPGKIWRINLRRSVRLYLALNEPGNQELAIEARLRILERQLLNRLQRAHPHQLSLPEAQARLATAQWALLSSAAEVALLRAELSIEQAIGLPHGRTSELT